MTFPTVQARNESAVSTAGTSHQVSLPTGIQSGDLLLVLINKGSTSATFNALTGWTELIDEAQANGNFVLYRLADGTEGATITLTSSASTRSAHTTYRISGAADPGTQAPEISTVATGTSVSPDPGSLSPTGGAKDYLWIAFFGDAGEEADDDTWCNNAPANYTNLLQKTGGIAGTNLGGIIASAERTNNAASEDPGAFNQDASLAWRAYTIAIHPTPDQPVGDPYQRDPRWYRANIFFRPSAEPFQSLGDATPPSGEASITLTDTGTASDSISISVDLSLSDTGAADDQLVAGSTDPNQASPQFATMFLEPSWASFQLLGDATTNAPTLITLTDAGTAADTISVTATVPLADTGAGSDSLTVSVAVPLSDTGASNDALSVSAAVPLTDTGAAADTASIAADVPLTDVGIGADSINVNTGVDPYQTTPPSFPPFTAPFVEPTAKPFQLLGDASGIVQVSLTDSGIGADTLDVTATLPLSDMGAGADSVGIAAALPLTDTAAAADALALTAAVPLGDTGAGADSLNVDVLTVTDPFQAPLRRFGWALKQPQWVEPFQLLGDSEAVPPPVPVVYGTSRTGTGESSRALVGAGAGPIGRTGTADSARGSPGGVT